MTRRPLSDQRGGARPGAVVPVRWRRRRRQPRPGVESGARRRQQPYRGRRGKLIYAAAKAFWRVVRAVVPGGGKSPMEGRALGHTASSAGGITSGWNTDIKGARQADKGLNRSRSPSTLIVHHRLFTPQCSQLLAAATPRAFHSSPSPSLASIAPPLVAHFSRASYNGADPAAPLGASPVGGVGYGAGGGVHHRRHPRP